MLARKNQKAFTLIELLVVVAIIALLVSIMVPAVQNAMDTATDGVVKTQLHNIEVGLELFKNDNVVGGDYPPSADPNLSPQSGAELLCNYLMGEDLKGLDPDYDPTATPSVPFTATNPRRGPFIKLGTVEFEAATAGYIMKDKWKMPILYYRATPGTPLTTLNGVVDFYTETDNKDFIDNYPDMPSGATNFDALTNNDFVTYITDKQILDVPYNPDTFILISAGKDKIYGNEDDVTNFEKRN